MRRPAVIADLHGDECLRRILDADKVAEGEELGSNLLQVRLRSPARNYANGSGIATKPTCGLIFGVP